MSTDGRLARTLRQVSDQRQTESRDEGRERWTLTEAAAVVGVRAPVSQDDLLELARACELAGVVTNLDDEAGAWREMRQAARVALRRLARLCSICGSARLVEAYGLRQCQRCGSLTAARTEQAITATNKED